MDTSQDSPFNNTADLVSRLLSMPAEDAQLTQFFLREAVMLCPIPDTDCSEYSKLHALCKRLKRIVRLFNLFYEHNWGEIFPDIQRAFGFYLLEGFPTKKERMRLVDLLAKEMTFVIKTAQFNDFITILQQHYIYQLSEIERILNTYYKPESVDPFTAQ